MRVKDLIERLTQYNNLDDEIIVDSLAHDDVNGWLEDSFTAHAGEKFVIDTENAYMSKYNNDL